MAKKSRKSNSASFATTAAGCVLDKNLARHDAKRLGLNKGELPNSIKEIISTLTDAGFEAYIVGGGVRDSLLGLQPKDFDAVTNATPNQIKDVFGKRCRIIGRRFQLCHVYSGRDMIEVATFRAPPKDTTHLTEDGMIMRDNVWGDIYQDVVRRDFSINALYYQPHDGIVYDFCGGLADIEQRTLRLLGDTQKRVEEDPVRLLRALRFKAKLNFHFDSALNQQFNPQSWALLAQVSPHRLYDETQKMFTGGYLKALLPLLFDYQALAHLVFYPPTLTPLLEQVTINTDKRIGQGKSINPAFFYAALLWENYLYLLEKCKKNTPFAEAQIQAANKVMDKQRVITAMPKFAEQFIKDIWLMQPRLANPRKKNLLKLFENPRFRAGFDFLLLREQVEAKNHSLALTHGEAVTLDQESTNGMGHWWAWFQTLNTKQQQQAIDEFDLDKVKVRFANIVTPPSEAASAVTRPKNRCERRQAKLDASDWAQDANNDASGLTASQQQREKDQLRQLSLANHQTAPSAPKSLWQAQADSHYSVVDSLDDASIDTDAVVTSPRARPARRRDSDKRFDDSKTLSPAAQNRRDNRQGTGNLPARRRRIPSDTLSILERQLAENALENKAETVIEPQAEIVNQLLPIEKATPIPKKRTRKKVIEVAKTVETVETQAENVAETAETIAEQVTEKPPVKRGRKPKVKVENNETAEVLATQNETLPKKVPAKRTRKKVVKTDKE